MKVEGRDEPFEPKDSDIISCDVHGVFTTWGKLDPIQRLAVEEGIDTGPEFTCLLARG